MLQRLWGPGWVSIIPRAPTAANLSPLFPALTRSWSKQRQTSPANTSDVHHCTSTSRSPTMASCRSPSWISSPEITHRRAVGTIGWYERSSLLREFRFAPPKNACDVFLIVGVFEDVAKQVRNTADGHLRFAGLQFRCVRDDRNQRHR